MCGIFGIVTCEQQNVATTVLNGLRQLQNRGYDSAGVALLQSDGTLHVHKYASTPQETAIEKLEQATSRSSASSSSSSVGIGHNRWATHGAKNDTNAHPHLSHGGRFAVVHNGIIENYRALKEFLQSHGTVFLSQTDTEVVVNLIQYYFDHDARGSTTRAIQRTLEEIQGTYGLVIIDRLQPDRLYAVRNGSPLLVGATDEYVIVTSEQSGFCGLVNTYITLLNDDLCTVSLNQRTVQFTTSHEYSHKHVSLGAFDLTPQPYMHWTLKEIFEQPMTVQHAINRGGRIRSSTEVKLGGLEPHTDRLKNIDHLVLLGCGTSLHACLFGARMIKRMSPFKTVQVIDGADLVEEDLCRSGNTAFVLVSQSGETRDLHKCLLLAKKLDIFTIGVINVVDSLIAREVDCGIYCNAGREMAVASTKAFTSQVISLSLLAIWFAQIHQVHERQRAHIIADLHNLSNDFSNTLADLESDDDFKNIVQTFMEYQHVFLLGKGLDEYVAKEGALKIKEIAYLHAEAYSSTALKHGPFALLDEDFPTILLHCAEEHHAKNMNCLEEVYSRHSPVVVITNSRDFFYHDNVPVLRVAHNATFSSLLGVIPLQLLAYYVSVGKGINPDIPKNLAKVVTVE